MKPFRAAWAAIGLLLLSSLSAEAKQFRNAYVSFELPANWECVREGAEHICSSQYNRAAKEAIIILTAKEVGPTDTFAAYMGHLQAPRTIPSKAGEPSQSKVLHVKQRKISDWDWIDGLHLGSEVGPYYTRYLATIKDRIAVLVTFSAHKQFYTKYSNDFLKAIASLKVVASKDLLGPQANAAPGLSKETVGAPIDAALPSDMISEQFPDEDSSGGLGDMLSKLIGLALLIGAIGFYLMRKKKKPKDKKGKKSK